MQNNKTALNCKTFVGTGHLANLISIIIQALSKFYLFCKLCDAPHSFHSESRDNNKGLVQDVIKHYSSKHGVKLKTSDVRSSHFPGGKETFKMNNINNFFKGSQTLEMEQCFPLHPTICNSKWEEIETNLGFYLLYIAIIIITNENNNYKIVAYNNSWCSKVPYWLQLTNAFYLECHSHYLLSL